MDINKLSNKIISSAIEVHKAFGPGLLESLHFPASHQKVKKIILCALCVWFIVVKLYLKKLAENYHVREWATISSSEHMLIFLRVISMILRI